MSAIYGLGTLAYGQEKRIARPVLCSGVAGNFTPTDLTAYFVYLGFTVELVTPLRVYFILTVNGGTGTAEVGFFSTPAAPTFATGQTLTKIVAGATESITAGATAVKKNSSNFATALTVPVHLWAGIRVDQAGTNAQIRGIGGDYTDGSILALAASGTFAATSTFAGTVPALSGAGVTGPDLIGALN